MGKFKTNVAVNIQELNGGLIKLERELLFPNNQYLDSNIIDYFFTSEYTIAPYILYGFFRPIVNIVVRNAEIHTTNNRIFQTEFGYYLKFDISLKTSRILKTTGIPTPYTAYIENGNINFGLDLLDDYTEVIKVKSPVLTSLDDELKLMKIGELRNLIKSIGRHFNYSSYDLNVLADTVIIQYEKDTDTYHFYNNFAESYLRTDYVKKILSSVFGYLAGEKLCEIS
jgi:hypothetical protein